MSGKDADETDPTPNVIEPPWWRPPRPGRRRQPLSREAIVEAALRILDADGADALTVRRLGDELNTGSATLYWHIGSTNELGEIVYDHVMGGIELPEPDPSRWQEQFKDLGRQAYKRMLEHKAVVRYSLGRVPVGPNMLRVMEWSLELLRLAGIPDLAAGFAGDMLGRYLDASILEVTDHGGPPPELVGQYFGSLPTEQFPNMIAISKTMYTASDDERFEFGLDLLVRGLAAYAENPPNDPAAAPAATKRTRTRR